ncbi:MAG: zinc ribbon domain-containing protein [Dehalococcoidia bacterium]|nr:zinc ribbon domain-containing protein [Dehalococcoidia bacterium]
MSVPGSLLVFGVDNGWANAAIIAGIVVAAYLLIMWLAAVVWTARDIHARTQDGVTQAICVLLVAVFNLPGVLLYFLLRPRETLVERAERELELDAFLHEVDDAATCPGCQRRVDASFIACPYCRTRLATPCPGCARNVAEAWTLCPYCLRERDEFQGVPAAAASNGPSRAHRPWRRSTRPQPTLSAPASLRRRV